jgi:hypothetical protein
MEKRVDIKLEEEVLKWAAIEAAKMGISRRQCLSKIIKDYITMRNSFRKECPEYKYELYDFNKSNKPYKVEEI